MVIDSPVYKFDTKISNEGIISLPFEPQLFNMDVELIIVPKEKTIRKKDKYTALDFLKEWSGAFKDNDDEINDARYEYLMEKYK
jgi:hypothetical protein